MRGPSEGRRERVERYAAGRMGPNRTPGLDASLIEDYEIAWSTSLGVRELGARVAIDEGTIFQAGSVSKTVFSYAVMRLVQQARVSLDRDIGEYLKSWAVPDVEGWKPRVTLRHLLSHSAGFTQIGFMGYERSEEAPGIIEILEGGPRSRIKPIVVDSLPGLNYRYSGGGYAVAQAAIADVLGIPFADFMKETVLDPLGMDQSTFECPLPPKWEPSAASGHLWNLEPVEGGWRNMPVSACGGLWSCSKDLARFGLELQRAARGESALLDRDRLAEMTAPGVDEGYGLGIRLWGKGQTRQLFHYGGNQGFMSVLMLYPHLGKGASLMINSNHEEMLDEALLKIADEYEWPDFMLRDKERSRLPVKDLAGGYRLANGSRIDITIDRSGFLWLRYEGQEPKFLTSPIDNRCVLRPLNTEAWFSRNEDGRIELALIQDSRKHVAVKIDG